MKYREIAKILKALGCTSRSGKGDHEVWTCPCGQHRAVVTKPGEVSPGIVRDLISKFTCLKKGWLQ
ncbi:HicA-like toxin of HicAB toxin-antitoxin system [Promicromonospora sp. AC04]|nr:HicA-like toxin of HicAB toxin-antitoxin system [Promicromonospora sp. AC04]